MFLKKFCIALSASLFLMSSTKCEKEAAPEGRQLKKNVRIMQMSALTALDNSGFSFSETAQSQLPGVLFEKNYFYERNTYPVYTQQQTDGSLRSGIVKSSVERIQRWFPTIKTQEVDFSQESSCMFTRPQHYIAGKINALEGKSGTTFQFKLSQAAVSLPISAKFSMSEMRMDLSFYAYNPWTQQNVGSVNSSAIKKDYQSGFGLDLGIFQFGTEFYRTTGLAEVTLNGLRNGVADLAKKLLSSSGEVWESYVVLPHDNYVVFLGGSELGIQKGDQFKIYNQVHTWTGEPCGTSSILSGSVTVSDTLDPWIVEVEDANGDGLTKARILNVKEGSSIQSGALVRLHKFVGTTQQ